MLELYNKKIMHREMTIVVDSTMVPQRFLVLMYGACECVTLHGKRDFADVIKDLEMGRISWIVLMGPV